MVSPDFWSLTEVRHADAHDAEVKVKATSDGLDPSRLPV